MRQFILVISSGCVSIKGTENNSQNFQYCTCLKNMSINCFLCLNVFIAILLSF